MTRLKDITFESGSLTGTDGADLSAGTGGVVTPGLKGSYAAKYTAGNSYIREQFSAVGEIFISFYAYIEATTSSTGRIAELRNGSASAGPSVRYSNNGQIRLYNQGGAQVGSGVAVSLNTLYRIGLRYKAGTGANAIGELYVATEDNAFPGSPNASYTNGTETDTVTETRIGSPTSTVIDWRFDDVRIDDAAMPGPSTSDPPSRPPTSLLIRAASVPPAYL